MCTTPQALRNSSSSGSKANLVSSGIDEGKESPTKALPSANISSKDVEPSKDAKKVANLTKEAACDAALPPMAPKDSSKDKEVS